MISDTANFQIYGSNGAQNRVTKAIQNASAKTGVDFDYLVKQARVESSMNPNAKAKTSSATGLYQFIDQTWLREIKTHGAEHGYGKYADAIKQNSSGEYYVPNPATKRAILNLRKDPQASSLMAAELAMENHSFLSETTGIKPSGTDLYMAHFLGAQGASNFITSMKKNPWAPAASFFPEAARSNKGVFYAQGRPLSLQQVYNKFDTKFSGGGGVSGDAPVQTASATYNLDNTDQGPEVILPSAIRWNDPGVAQAQDIVLDNQGAVRMMTSEASEIQQETRTVSRGRGFAPRVQWSPDMMVMAQATSPWVHSDQRRYNT